MELNIAGIVSESIVDGPGIRYAVFVQGCPHRCPGCHNPETHPFAGGRSVDTDQIFQEFQEDPLLRGITFSGGEPFCQPEPLAGLARLVHGAGKDVAVFTGYTYEQLLEQNSPAARTLLEETDLLVDGPYVQEQRDLELRFRGSSNQRLIDVKRSLATGRAVLWEGGVPPESCS